MVMARLHTICGNCGSNDNFEWEHIPKTDDAPETVYLRCKNCGTLHDINDNAKQTLKTIKDNNG